MLEASQAQLHEDSIARTMELHADVLQMAHQFEAEFFVQFDGGKVERFFAGTVGNDSDDVVEIGIEVCSSAFVDEGSH